MGSTLTPPGQPGPLQPGEFMGASSPNAVSWAFDGIDPPAGLYVQRDDTLVLEAFSTTVDLVTVTARLLLPMPSRGGQPSDGVQGQPATPAPGGANIVTIQRTLVPGTSGLFASVVIPLAEGYLLSIAVTAATPIQRGITFVRAFLARNAITNAITFPITNYVLFADYVSSLSPTGWPAGRTIYPTEGPGNLRTAVVGSPGAGSDWQITVPSGVRWRVQSLNAQLAIVNSGTPRVVRLKVADVATHLLWQAAAQQAGAVNTTVQLSACSGQVTSTIDTTTLNVCLPSPLMMATGATLTSSTINIVGSDQWSNIALQVEEWLDQQ